MKTNHKWTSIGTRTDGPPSTTTGAKMLRHFCPVGVTLSWEEVPPGARASRPHKSSRSFGHLLHRNQPAAAPCLCFGRAHAVPAGRAVGCNIAGKLSGNRRDSMRAGRPRSRVGRPDGEVGGIRRATSLRADGRPLGNSRLSASPAPALPGGSYESETIRNRQSCRDLGTPSRLTSAPSWSFVVLRVPSWITLFSFVSGKDYRTAISSKNVRADTIRTPLYPSRSSKS